MAKSARHTGFGYRQAGGPAGNSDISIYYAGTEELRISASAISPGTSDGIALGTSALLFSDLFLASGAVINFNNGDVTITHAANILTIAGGTTVYSGNITVEDLVLLGIGTGNTARLSWDSTDANANELLLQMPAGGAVDVPVLGIGQVVEAVDLGLFNGVVDPTIALFGVGAVTTSTRLRAYKARGTVAAPTVVTTGDDLFSIDAYGAVAAGEYVQAARILFEMTGTIATTRGPGVITFQTATDAAPSVLTTALVIGANQSAAFANAITSSHATAGVGYATGAGGTVSQITSKSTGVTLNTITGIITMNNAALAADTTVAFTLTDSAIAATDAVVVLHESGGTIGAYSFGSTAASGSVVISVHNNTPGSLSDAVVLRFVVVKSVNA